MSMNIATEKRMLTSAEFEHVLQSHHPHLETLTPDALAAVERQIRVYRDKARDVAHARRRAQRGKSDPQGRGPAPDEHGLAVKGQIFAAALQRLGLRRRQTEQAEARKRNLQGLRDALDRKRGAKVHHPQSGRTANTGMRPADNPTPTVSPDPREIGRVSQFVKDAQAQRDRRPG